MDEQWFTLNVDLLRKALEITPIDSARPFVSPLAGEQVMDFVNELDYLKEIHFVSKMHVNNLYQPWRAILSLINQCLTGKTSGFDKPRHLVLQMLWGIVTRTNVDYVELLWEEFVQAIQIFFAHWASLNVPTKKPTPHVIPYCRFTKLIIYYLGIRHNIHINIHRRPVSPVHVTGDDFLLSNQKFVPKGEKDEVFGKPIPKELITEAVQNSPYYQQYLEMVARKLTAKRGEQKKTTSKADKPKKPAPAKQPTLAEQTKPVKEKTSKPTPSKKTRKGKVMKVRKEKRYDRLVDEEDEKLQPAFEPHVEDDEYDLQRGIQMSLESFQPPVGGVTIRVPASGVTRSLPVVEGKGKGIATDEQVAQLLLELHKPKKQSTTDQYIFQRRIPGTQEASIGPSTQPEDDTSANVVRDTPSPADAEIGADTEKSNSEGDTEILNVDEERGKNVSDMAALEDRTVELDEGKAESDPGKTPESRPLPERVLIEEDQAGSNPGQSHVALAGPNPKPMHKDFVSTVYPQVHESLKHTTEEYVHLENPLSSIGTLSSMKNLDDAFTFGDQFLNDKPTKEEPKKANVDAKVESMVTVPIHQASSSAPPLSTPVIDLTPPKPSAPPVQELIFTATTASTTTTLLPPPPPLQQSTSDTALAARVSALEHICANLAKKNKLQDQTTQALSSRIFTLENHDLYSKIDKYVNEVIKEAVHNAHQAPIRERFRDLSEFEMKEILRDRMFESGSYKSHLEHITLYEALEASMDRENSEEFMEAMSKSRKRSRDDQDPPLPPPNNSDQSKKKRHDSDASASKQPQAHTSLAWKTSDTIEAPSSSSKQKTASQSEQLVDDIPIPDDVHFSDLEDTSVAHLPKIKPKSD
ncbi:hypothetical protein Tco_0223673 [Tanacetum coccineum]